MISTCRRKRSLVWLVNLYTKIKQILSIKNLQPKRFCFSPLVCNLSFAPTWPLYIPFGLITVSSIAHSYVLMLNLAEFILFLHYSTTTTASFPSFSTSPHLSLAFYLNPFRHFDVGLQWARFVKLDFQATLIRWIHSRQAFTNRPNSSTLFHAPAPYWLVLVYEAHFCVLISFLLNLYPDCVAAVQCAQLPRLCSNFFFCSILFSFMSSLEMFTLEDTSCSSQFGL